MAKRVLILGGGFGGVAAAVRLRDLLDSSDEIVLVDKTTEFMMGFRKSLALVGKEPWDSYRRPLKALEKRGVTVVHETITKIDPAAKAVEAGGALEGDAMLVALGAEVMRDAVPGLKDHGFSAYNTDDIPRAAHALGKLREGRVVVAIFGMPYKCSPAPFELAILADDAARERKQNLMFTVTTPAPRSLPVLGAAGCAVVEGFLFGRGIQFRANAKPKAVEKDRLVLEDGEVPFELLLGVPPHRVPPPVASSGLTGPAGWVKVNPRTLETPGHEGVWAVGDVVGFPMANEQPFPKAGVFAANEGVVAAERIAAYLAGKPSDTTFDGVGGCWLEVGDGKAVMVRGNFLASPAPEVELTEPSSEMLAEKESYERQTLDAWFGPA
jgi:sulfide:quinone oxidoreductase